MKTKLKLVIFLFIGLAFSANAQKTTITKAALPTNAQTFLKTHFPKQEPSYIIKDKEVFSTDYKVQFKNNIEVEFDEKGNWEEVDGSNTSTSIPKTIIPKTVVSYIKTNFSNTTVTKISKDTKGYEVNLNTGLELKFNTKGSFIRIDN